MLVEQMQLTPFLQLLQPLHVVFETMNKPMTKMTVLLPIKTRLHPACSGDCYFHKHFGSSACPAASRKTPELTGGGGTKWSSCWQVTS